MRFARRGWQICGGIITSGRSPLSTPFSLPDSGEEGDKFHFNERFDLIVLNQTFEHVPNPAEVLRYLRTISTSPGAGDHH
jgi:hypothetical protein